MAGWQRRLQNKWLKGRSVATIVRVHADRRALLLSAGALARIVLRFGREPDGPGAINVPITAGGMPVNAGDIIVGDQDGLLAFPPSLAATVIEKALAQEQNENGTIHAIREGRWDRAFVDTLEARCAN